MIDESYSFSLRQFEKGQNSNRNMNGSIGPNDNQRNSIMSIHENISIKNNESISKGIGSSQRNTSYKVNLL